jgi:hypothetical protein
LISGFAVLEPVIRVRYIRNCPAGARIDHRTAAEIFNCRLAAGPAAEERAVAVARLAAGPLAAYLPDATREPVLRIRGSGAFLTPGSGIGFFPDLGIRDLGSQPHIF